MLKKKVTRAKKGKFYALQLKNRAKSPICTFVIKYYFISAYIGQGFKFLQSLRAGDWTNLCPVFYTFPEVGVGVRNVSLGEGEVLGVVKRRAPESLDLKRKLNRTH